MICHDDTVFSDLTKQESTEGSMQRISTTGFMQKIRAGCREVPGEFTVGSLVVHGIGQLISCTLLNDFAPYTHTYVLLMARWLPLHGNHVGGMLGVLVPCPDVSDPW